MSDDMCEVTLDFERSRGIPDGTYIFKVLDTRLHEKKDDTGAPIGNKAIIVEIEAIAGSNPEGIGCVHEEWFQLPNKTDNKKSGDFKMEKLTELAVAGKLLAAEEAKGSGTFQFAKLKGRQIAGSIKTKGDYTNLVNLKGPDDASVAHLVGTTATKVASPNITV